LLGPQIDHGGYMYMYPDLVFFFMVY
jgi:hypothetical protein